MKINWIQIIFTCCIWIGNGVALNQIESGEYKLVNDLFGSHYNKNVRPQSMKEIMYVDVDIKLNKVANVIEDHQTMNIQVKMKLSWFDKVLRWDPTEYENIKSLVLPSKQIWIPDLHLFNSVSEDDRIYPINVEIFSNGTVISYPITNLNAHCSYNFKRFPFDYQQCQFLIGSMLENVHVRVKTSFNLNDMRSNSEWKFLSISDGERYSFSIPGTTHSAKEAFFYDWYISEFQVHIKRISSFYVNLFIWPLVLMLFVGVVIFILPPSCVERVSMGSLLLLSLVVLSLILESFTPKSPSTSVVGNLIGFNMFMITWATVASTLIISIDKENFLMVKKIPRWLITIMLNYVGKVTLKQEALQAVFNNQVVRNEEIELIDTNQILHQNQTLSNNNDDQETNSEIRSNNLVDIASTSSVQNLDINQAESLLVLINNQIAMLRRKFQESDLKESNRKEWYLIALVCDRLCLIIYSIVSFVGLFVILI